MHKFHNNNVVYRFNYFRELVLWSVKIRSIQNARNLPNGCPFRTSVSTAIACVCVCVFEWVFISGSHHVVHFERPPLTSPYRCAAQTGVIWPDLNRFWTRERRLNTTWFTRAAVAVVRPASCRMEFRRMPQNEYVCVMFFFSSCFRYAAVAWSFVGHNSFYWSAGRACTIVCVRMWVCVWVYAKWTALNAECVLLFLERSSALMCVQTC